MEDVITAVVLAVAVLLVALLLSRSGLLPRRSTIFEFERGLYYRGGRFQQVLGPGQYWLAPYRSHVIKVDVRPRFVTLSGQEVLSADGVAMKMSVAAKFEIVDPSLAVSSAQDYQSALYLELQLCLRGIVGAAKVDEVLEKRAEIGGQLLQLIAGKAEELGLRLLAVDVKDIMFPGDLKKVFSQVVRARQEGLAALEKARGETAALRNLANAARLVEEKPALLQLRLLQQVGSGTGNSLVIGMPASSVTLPIAGRKSDQSESPEPGTAKSEEEQQS